MFELMPRVILSGATRLGVLHPIQPYSMALYSNIRPTPRARFPAVTRPAVTCRVCQGSGGAGQCSQGAWPRVVIRHGAGAVIRQFLTNWSALVLTVPHCSSQFCRFRASWPTVLT